MWSILVLCIFLIILFYLYRSRNKNYWDKKGVPCAGGYHWFFGHYKAVTLKEKHLIDIVSDVYREFPEASVVGYLQMSMPILMVRDPDIIKAVLTTDFNHFARNQFLVEKSDFLFGNNPFVLWGEAWKKARGHATPSVTFAKLKGYLPAMLGVGQEMVHYVRGNMDEKGAFLVEAKEFSSKFTMDVVSNAVVGIKNNAFETTDSLFEVIMKEIFSGFFIPNLKGILHVLFPDVIKSIRFTSKQSEKVLLSLTRKMLREKTKASEKSDRGGPRETSTDLFQQLLTCRQNDRNGVFTDEYIASNVYAFMLDGYETSSILICYALFELAWNKNVQEKLRAEVMELHSKTNGEITVEDIEGLQYLDKVVMESLRLHPPAPVITKLCTQNYTVKNIKGCKSNSLEICDGTVITIPIMELHLDAQYYPAPERFDPERFSEEEVVKRHKFVYLPFGEGPRRCLGQRFGLLQTKVAVIKIVENFRLEPSDKSKYPSHPDPQIFILNRPLNGAWITLKKLN